MADDDREYVAGEELDADAKAFLAKEEGGEPTEPKDKAKFEPDFDPNEAAAASEEEASAAEALKAAEKAEEDRARLMGWAPKDKWRGDPDRWIDAKTFNERTNPGILHERLEKIAKERERDLQKFEESAARMERMNQAALKRLTDEHDARIKALQEQRDRQVIEVAAEHGAEAAQQHQREWETYIAGEAQKKPVAPEPAPAQADQMPAETAAWVDKHPHYKTDPTFGAAAFWTMDKIHKEMGDKPMAEQFAELDRRMAPRFPEYYPKQASNTGGVTTNGAPPADARAGTMDGVRIAPKKSTNYAARMNAAERRQGERFVKSGLYKDLESYAKELHAND